MTGPVHSPDTSAVGAPDAGGEIYDLGYRNYEGQRLGRRAAVISLAVLSLRNTYGLGRGTFPKVLAFGLAAAAMLPAFVVMLVAILAGVDNAGSPEYSSFFAWSQLVLVVFVAAMASELIGSDRRHHILPLYFSRPIERDDYVLAKTGALTVGLLPLTLLPLLLIFTGNWLGAKDTSSWLGDNYGDLWPILVSSMLLCIQLATVGMSISMFTSRRAFALLAVLGGLLGSSIVAAIVIELADSNWTAIAGLLSPLTTTDAAVSVLFDSEEIGSNYGNMIRETPGWLWITASLLHATIALVVGLHRYRKTSL